jgi:PTS system nitrogen regulatory IIA component
MTTHPTTSPVNEAEYLTIGQLAEYLGWSARFIEGLVRGERMPGLEIDGQWRFRRDDVVDWLEQKIQTLDTARVAELENKLESLATLAEATGLLFDKQHLLDSLVERESLCSTAMPGGVALCHPRRPIPSIIQRQFLAFLRTEQPVDFGAEDGEGTTLFFLLCTPDDRSHLHGLARLARVLNSGTLESLLNASDSAEVLAILAHAEAEVQNKE